jgi:hypothetical protein
MFDSDHSDSLTSWPTDHPPGVPNDRWHPKLQPSASHTPSLADSAAYFDWEEHGADHRAWLRPDGHLFGIYSFHFGAVYAPPDSEGVSSFWQMPS